MYKYWNGLWKFGTHPYFAADDGAGNGGGEGANGGGTEGGEKTYSHAELNALVAKKLAEAAKKNDVEFEKRLADAIAKRDEEAKLTAEQLAQKKFEEREAALAKREKDFLLNNRKLEASQALTKVGFVDKDLEQAMTLINFDAENISQQVEVLDGIIKSRVKAQLDSQYKQPAPNGGTDGGAQKSEYAKFAEARAKTQQSGTVKL